MKYIIGRLPFLMLLAVITTSLCGCRGDSGELKYGTYQYEKEGIGSEFTLTVNEDGTFWYYEGNLSSYFGNGTWTYEDGIFTVTDNGIPGSYGSLTYVNRFTYDSGTLTFIGEDSDGFMYIEVLDGDRFFYTD